MSPQHTGLPLSLTPSVKTTYGEVAGFICDQAWKFLGIPYGASTGGAGRFRPPRPPESWTGLRLATQYGLSAPQREGTGSALFGWYRSPYGFSEDCLSLNVFTPATEGERRPVLVWLHGGGFAAGSGTSFAFDGGHMASRDEVIVVSLNHRLNLFGFLHPEAGEAEGFSPNVGMQDIVAALAWLRDNIANFGGDPNNITLFGESGGGAKVGVLMGMPTAAGLFHKAIIQSAGAGYVALTVEEAHANARAFLSRLGLAVHDLDRLQAASAPALVNAYAEMLPDGIFVDLFRPVVDGFILPENPFSPNAPLLAREVPLIIGCTAQESTFGLVADARQFDMDRTDAVRRTEAMVGPAAETIFSAYERTASERSPCELYVQISNDFRFKQRLVFAALKRLEQSAAPTYVYSFEWPSPALDGRLKAAHTLELPFVFDNTEQLTVLVGQSPDVPVLASQMRRAWTSFARSGDPNHSQLPHWAAFSQERRETMVFDRECICIEDHPSPERQMLLPHQPDALKLASRPG